MSVGFVGFAVLLELIVNPLHDRWVLDAGDDVKGFTSVAGAMAANTPARRRAAMTWAQPRSVGTGRFRNCNPWYVEVARSELEAMQGELYDKAVAAAGRETVDHNIDTWGAMLKVLETGEHCPHHLRGRKPE